MWGLCAAPLWLTVTIRHGCRIKYRCKARMLFICTKLFIWYMHILQYVVGVAITFTLVENTRHSLWFTIRHQLQNKRPQMAQPRCFQPLHPTAVAPRIFQLVAPNHRTVVSTQPLSSQRKTAIHAVLTIWKLPPTQILITQKTTPKPIFSKPTSAPKRRQA